MHYEPITLERLDNFSEILKEYEILKRYKQNLIAKCNTLKSIDYSKIKVQTGNGAKTSEQEYYAMKLQSINNKMREYETWITPEKEIIKNQIARVPKRDYRKLLILRYIEKWKWAEIVQEFFEFENDYEEGKGGRYRDMIMYWNRRALEELQKISSKPYEPVIKQLNLIENTVITKKEGKYENYS